MTIDRGLVLKDGVSDRLLLHQDWVGDAIVQADPAAPNHRWVSTHSLQISSSRS